MAEVASLSSGDEAASWGGSEERETDSRDEGDAGREVQLSGDDFALNFGPPLQLIHCWKKLSSCEEFVGAKRSKHTIVAWNEKMYVFGGDNGRKMLNDFLVSHIRDCSWARVVYTGEYLLPFLHDGIILTARSFLPFRAAASSTLPSLCCHFPGQHVHIRRVYGRHLLQFQPSQ